MHLVLLSRSIPPRVAISIVGIIVVSVAALVLVFAADIGVEEEAVREDLLDLLQQRHKRAARTHLAAAVDDAGGLCVRQSTGRG